MRLFDSLDQDNLERRELQLIVLACLTIVILAAGLVVLMYPVVFESSSADVMTRTEFIGFCGLSVLAAAYIIDRQLTIMRLRRRIAEDVRRNEEAKGLASAEVLRALPKLTSFKDRLPMEHRRATTTAGTLSALVVTIEFRPAVTNSLESTPWLADAVITISRKLRAEDSIYGLRHNCFCVLLPGIDALGAQKIAARVREGLRDTAGTRDKFSYKIDTVNCPLDASSAHELQEAVLALVPGDDSMETIAGEMI